MFVPLVLGEGNTADHDVEAQKSRKHYETKRPDPSVYHGNADREVKQSDAAYSISQYFFLSINVDHTDLPQIIDAPCQNAKTVKSHQPCRIV